MAPVNLSPQHPATAAPSSSPTTRKRKRNEDSMPSTSASLALPDPTTRSPILSPIILPDIRHNPDEPYVEPPSPVPTEIVEEISEPSSDDIVAAAKEHGIKVRDFAYEPQPKDRPDIRAPEFWSRPLDKLMTHDRYIRINLSSTKYSPGIPGKLLWGLLSTNLVSQQEAEINWRPKAEWKAYNEYVNRPLGPYPITIPKSFKQPTAAYRKRLADETYPHSVPQEDLRPEGSIYMPPDVPGMDDGATHLPDAKRELPRVVRAPPNRTYLTVYEMRPQREETSKPQPASPAPSRPPSTKPTRSRPATPATPSSATDHNAIADAVHVNKRRRTSGPPAVPSACASNTPPATPPAGSSRSVGRTLSRSASYGSLAGSPRSQTPPAGEGRPLGRTLGRTTTLSRIPVQ